MAKSSLARRLYNVSPPLLQDVMASAAGYQRKRHRFGYARYQFWEQEYRRQLEWPEARLREHQWNEFQRVLRHAHNTVPFYRDRFRDLNIDPADIQKPQDVGRLPMTSKEDVQNHSERIISESFARASLSMDTTGGSTGKPLRVYNSRDAVARNYAVRWSQCRPGLARNMWYGNFTGVEIVSPMCSRPPFWRTNYPGRQRLYSLFHMSDEFLAHYVKDLQRFKPQWLYGFPSALYTVANFMESNGLRLEHRLRAIVTSSEQLFDHYRETIERVFETNVWDEYGQAEFVGLAFQCACGKMHENISYSFVEFIPTGKEEDGLPVFELVCTSTINPAWPLIRYRVGDTVLIDPEARCPLGRPGRVIERIHGRTSQFLETKDGRQISNITSMARNCRNIKSCQAVQEKPGEMVLRIVKDRHFNADDEKLAIGEFRKKLGDDSQMTIRIDQAESPLLTPSGKFMLIVQKKRAGLGV